MQGARSGVPSCCQKMKIHQATAHERKNRDCDCDPKMAIHASSQARRLPTPATHHHHNRFLNPTPHTIVSKELLTPSKPTSSPRLNCSQQSKALSTLPRHGRLRSVELDMALYPLPRGGLRSEPGVSFRRWKHRLEPLEHAIVSADTSTASVSKLEGHNWRQAESIPHSCP